MAALQRRPLVGLVACGSAKLDRPAPARELYIGNLFRAAADYAERSCDEWLILSALYGVVVPDQELAPYDYSLVGAPVARRRAWAIGVWRDLAEWRARDARFMLLAGDAYARFLEPLLGSTNVDRPLRGLGLGRQLAWYAARR